MTGTMASHTRTLSARTGVTHTLPRRRHSIRFVSIGNSNTPEPRMDNTPEVCLGSGRGWRNALTLPNALEASARHVAQASTAWSQTRQTEVVSGDVRSESEVIRCAPGAAAIS
jgi:hypothetical protein